jgi:hypothetical protein
MIKSIQNNVTNIKTASYLFPVGTVFTGFLNISQQSSDLMTASIQWFIGDDTTSPVLGLNLPYGLEIPLTVGGQPVYTFNTDINSNLPFNAALYINTQIVVMFINSVYTNLQGSVQIINIPL